MTTNSISLKCRRPGEDARGAGIKTSRGGSKVGYFVYLARAFRENSDEATVEKVSDSYWDSETCYYNNIKCPNLFGTLSRSDSGDF